MTKKSELLPLLLETATIAVKHKTHLVRKASRRKVSREVYLNHVKELEDALAVGISKLIQEQAMSMEGPLLSIAGEKDAKVSDQAASLARQIFDPKDPKWKDKLVDVTLPAMAISMLKAMKAGMVEAGVNPTKGLKSNA